MKITVLLSTYNGEKYLQEQLDSLYAQDLPEGFAMEILVRDDGSSDQTVNILEENRKQGKLTFYVGENVKPAKSFWDLVQRTPASEYYAFCDQDDVWHTDKLLRAINRLREEKEQRQPLLYCSNVTVVDSVLNPIGNMHDGHKTLYTDFAHSLIYSLAPGCTMVFNHAAREAFLRYDMNEQFEVIHDWLAHKITAMLGTVIYDATPTMLYRQHGNNVIGAQTGGKLKSFLKKVKRVMGSYACVRSETAKSLYTVYQNDISEEQKHILQFVAYYRENKTLKKELLNSSAFTSSAHSYLKWAILKWAIRLNKV